MEQDDPHAAAQYLPRVYDKPRHLAAQGLAQEEAGQTREATEAYLRPTVRNGAARIRID